MLLEEFSEYRKKIMKALCSDKEIVRYITDDENPVLPNRDLIYKNIFPYAYKPDVSKKADTYICFSLGVDNVDGKTYKTISLVFYVFTYQGIIRTEDGLRPDLLAQAIDRMFNGNLELGLGRVKLVSVDDISPATNYHGVMIEYAVDEYNRPSIHGDKGRGF